MGFIGFIILFFGVLPAMTALNGYLRSRRGRTIVTVSPRGIDIRERGAWKTGPVNSLPAPAILDIDFSTSESVTTAARLAAEQRVRTSSGSGTTSAEIGPRTQWLLTTLSRYAKGHGITIKTRQGLTTFGQGLTDEETRYVHSMIRRALAGYYAPSTHSLHARSGIGLTVESRRTCRCAVTRSRIGGQVMRKCLWGMLLVAVVILLPSSASAQASIAGSTRDTSGAALPGVTVEASSPALIEKVRTAVTDERGLFRIVNLPPGTYSVTFALPGFNQVKRDGIELTGSFTATDRCRPGGRRSHRNDHGDRRVADRRRAEHQTADDDQQRGADRHSDGTLVGGHGAVDSRHRHHWRRPDRHPGHAADDRVRRRRRAQQRRPHAGGRPERGRGTRRQRRLDLHRRHFERAGSRDDDLRRVGRGRSRRPLAQHHPEERWQHAQRCGVSVRREQGHGREQLQRRSCRRSA